MFRRVFSSLSSKGALPCSFARSPPHDLAPLTEPDHRDVPAVLRELLAPPVGRRRSRLHHPARRHTYVAVAVAVAEVDDGIAGYVAWSVDPARRKGSVTILAVSAEYRRRHVGTTLCEHAFAQMRSLGAEAAEIGTGGDTFHAPARALYEGLGFTPLPVAVYSRLL
ncbi:GNAT family N-acetyltransferase [Streptomyces sp. NPDC003006]